MQSNICCIYLSGPKKTTNNLIRILSHILSFMLLQNKYKKCDYCLLLLSLFCVVCVLFLLLFPPFSNDSLSQACASRARQARTQHTLHTRLVSWLLLCCLVLSWLLLCCLVFDIYLFVCISTLRTSCHYLSIIFVKKR